MSILNKLYYQQDAITIAQSLIGKTLCRQLNNGLILLSTIVETEAYYGEDDTACHASKGKTSRTKVMYEKGGIAYIYLVYGMHYMLNIVTGPENHPQAVLIRAIQPLEHTNMIVKAKIKTNGPGKLCHYLSIDKKSNGIELNENNKLWIMDKNKKKPDLVKAERIGISYASLPDQQRKWRFYEKRNPFVSKF